MARYKRNVSNDEEMIECGKSLRVWDCGSPLYDSYELASLTHLIERHLMSHPSLTTGGSSKRFKMYQYHQMKHASTTMAAVSALNGSGSGDGVRFSGCMGNYFIGRKKRGGERVKKIKSKSKKLTALSINWFM